VAECVTGAFESRICKRTAKLIISLARELLKFFVLCDKLVSKE
jgi:tRNA isopentenyl-2-thiomethyl-A-37 hydroxylase MiaE